MSSEKKVLDYAIAKQKREQGNNRYNKPYVQKANN